MKLYRSNEERPPSVDIKLPITVRFGWASESVADYKNELQEALGLKLSTTLEMIDYFGEDITLGDGNPKIVGEWIRLLVEFGKAIEESTCLVREHFEKENADFETQKAEEKVLDLSGQVTAEDECIDLAKHLSAVLNHPLLPPELETVIHNGISDLGNESEVINKHYKSPEVLAELLNCDKSEVAK